MVDNVYKNTRIDKEKDNSAYTKAMQFVPDGSKVLELGCNEGYFSKTLKDKGCHVTGVEILEEAGKKAAKICDAFIQGDLDASGWAQGLKDGSFDTIVAMDVLEHLRWPEKVLKETRRLLSSEGQLVLSIPNIAHASVILELLQGRFDYRSLGILDKTHLHFYTLQSLKSLLGSTGYGIEAVKGIEFGVPLEEYRKVFPSIEKDELHVLQNIFSEPSLKVYQWVVKAKPGEVIEYKEPPEIPVYDYELQAKMMEQFERELEGWRMEALTWKKEGKAQKMEAEAQHREAEAQQREADAQHREAEAQKREAEAQKKEAGAQRREAGNWKAIAENRQSEIDEIMSYLPVKLALYISRKFGKQSDSGK